MKKFGTRVELDALVAPADSVDRIMSPVNKFSLIAFSIFNGFSIPYVFIVDDIDIMVIYFAAAISILVAGLFTYKDLRH